MSGPTAASPGVCAVTLPPQPGHLIGDTRVRDTLMGTTCNEWLSATCCIPKTQCSMAWSIAPSSPSPGGPGPRSSDLPVRWLQTPGLRKI